MNLPGDLPSGQRLAILFLFSCSFLSAQNASISGRVTDTSGGVVGAAEIILTGEKTGTILRAQSNKEGLYIFSSIQSGQYTLSATANGFKRFDKKRITVETAQTAVIDIQMQVGDSTQTVTVDGSGIAVNTLDATVSTLINRQFVENMPLNGRSFQSLLTLTPGVNVVVSSRGQGQSGSMSVNGQRTESNYFMVDGVSANTGAYPSTPGWGGGYSGSTPGETALGTTQSLVSVDALEEFRSTTATYSAEHGRFPGGQFFFTTRSGTNDFHGTLFHYFRNDALDASNWFINATGGEKAKQRQNNFGGTLGGPVVVPGLYKGENRTFFFFNYEGLRLRTPLPAVVTDVPSLYTRANAPESLQKFLNAFPLPNGPETGDGMATYIGSWSSPGSLNASSVRIDHHFSDRFKVFGRYNFSPSENQVRSTSNMARNTFQEGKTNSLTLGATNIFNSVLNNDFRFNLTKNNQGQMHDLDNFGGATPLNITSIPGYSDSNLHWVDFYIQWGLRPSFAFNPKRNKQTQINVNNTLSLFAGSHHLKFGFDYRQLGTRQPRADLYQFAMFDTYADLMSNTPSNVTMERFSGSVNPLVKNFSAFIQDEWRLHSRLNLSLGVRWDVNPAPTDMDGNKPYNADQIDDITKTALAPHDAPLFRTRWTNIAPRLGLAYRLNQKDGYETVIRTGAGLFYDTANSTATMGYFGVGLASALRFLNKSASFPAAPELFDQIPSHDTRTPYNFTLYAIDRNLKSPYSFQWSFAVEQGLGRNQTFTATYIGSGTRQLTVVRTADTNLLMATNPNFQNWGFTYTRNGANSSHQALQLQFQRRFSRGLQATVSHTWAHTIDQATNNFTTNKLLRGNSDYDIRHNFQAAVSYEVPGRYENAFASALLKNWAIDSRIVVRGGLPMDVIGTTGIDPLYGTTLSYQPDYVGGSLYVYGDEFPGGKKLNFNAFRSLPAGVQGNAGRNIARGFGAEQVDIAVRRTFPIGERFSLQFRAEAFNVLNHPMFGAMRNQLSVGADRFGLATNTQNIQLSGLNSLYQTGGPRSMQLSLRLRF